MADPTIEITNPNPRQVSAGGIIFNPGETKAIGPTGFQGPEGKWLAWACEPEVGLLTVDGSADEALKVAAHGKAKAELGVGDMAAVGRSLAKVGRRVKAAITAPAEAVLDPIKGE